VAGVRSSTSITVSAARKIAASARPARGRRAAAQGTICSLLASRPTGSQPSASPLLLDEWQTRGVAFVTLGEGIDTSTPAGRLVAGVLTSIAEFERARIQGTHSRWVPSNRHRSDAHAAVMAQARHSVRIRCVDRWV